MHIELRGLFLEGWLLSSVGRDSQAVSIDCGHSIDLGNNRA